MRSTPSAPVPEAQLRHYVNYYKATRFPAGGSRRNKDKEHKALRDKNQVVQKHTAHDDVHSVTSSKRN